MTRRIEITHPDKMLYPSIKWTKRDVADYYERIADWILPHLKGRPVVVQRYPDGVDEEGFYQQEVPGHYPDWIETIEVVRREKGKQNMLELHTKSALRYVVNQDGICFHTWQSNKEHINKPELLTYDLDPPGDDFSEVVKAVRILKGQLEDLGGAPFVMTTGSSGLHVVMPIKPELSFDEVREFAKTIAQDAVEKHPDVVTTRVRKDQREGKVFLDYLRNSYGQTTIAPYSLRSTKNGTVATPLRWEDLDDGEITSQAFNGKNLFKRIAKVGDPWKGMHRRRISIGDRRGK